MILHGFTAAHDPCFLLLFGKELHRLFNDIQLAIPALLIFFFCRLRLIERPFELAPSFPDAFFNIVQCVVAGEHKKEGAELPDLRKAFAGEPHLGEDILYKIIGYIGRIGMFGKKSVNQPGIFAE